MNNQTPSPASDQNGLEEPPIRKPKMLMAVVIILGVLLIAGFVLVIATIVIRVSQSGTDGTGKTKALRPGAVIEQMVPDGAVVQSMNLNYGLLAVHMQPKDGAPAEILVFDVKKRILLSHIRLGKAVAK